MAQLPPARLRCPRAEGAGSQLAAATRSGDTGTARPRGRMPGQEDALAAGCRRTAAPEPPGALQSLALGGTGGTRGLHRARRVTRAGWAGGGGRRAPGQLDVLCYSAAPQVGGPGAAEPALPEGDRARLVRQGERLGQGPLGTPHGMLAVGTPHGTLAAGMGLCEVGFGVRWGRTVRMSLSLATGVPGGGELGHQQHPGGGEGAEGERQRAGPDAVPGGSTALQVCPGSLRGAAAAPGTPGEGMLWDGAWSPPVPCLAASRAVAALGGAQLSSPGRTAPSQPHHPSAGRLLWQDKGCAGAAGCSVGQRLR